MKSAPAVSLNVTHKEIMFHKDSCKAHFQCAFCCVSSAIEDVFNARAWIFSVRGKVENKNSAEALIDNLRGLQPELLRIQRREFEIWRANLGGSK